jgi:hypothetical protein
MNITVYSWNLLKESCERWSVPRDFADPMLNYLVYGYSPGSCFYAVLANDWRGAIGSSHSMNSVEAFKALTGWIHDVFPAEARGSYQAVDQWCQLDAVVRRAILERQGLIYTQHEEVFKILRNEHTVEPVLY